MSLRRMRAFARYYLVGVETRSGRWFDLLIITAILVSVVELALSSVPALHDQFNTAMTVTEWTAGGLFAVEYFLRLWVARHRLRYIKSFWGVIDGVALLPFALRLFLPAIDLTFLRLFRVLRIFSLLKLSKYTAATRTLVTGLVNSRGKIAVFLVGVTVLTLIEGFTMHAIEPQTFPTVPDALWWTIVTVTTVGYGDLVPVTIAGKFLASFTMLTAFGIIAVPTGIVAAEFKDGDGRRGQTCARCGKARHAPEARYCDRCAHALGTLDTSEPA